MRLCYCSRRHLKINYSHEVIYLIVVVSVSLWFMNIILLTTCFISCPPESSNGVLLNRFKVMSGVTRLLSSIERDFWKFTARLSSKVEGDWYKYRLMLSKPTDSLKSWLSLIKGLNEGMTQFWMYAISADFMKTEPCGFCSTPLDCNLLSIYF